MPVNASLMKSLIKQYGPKKGKSVYAGLEATNSPAFQAGLKTAKKEGHTTAHFPKSKKKSRKK